MRLKKCITMLLTVVIACVLSGCRPQERPSEEVTPTESPLPDVTTNTLENAQTPFPTDEPTLAPRDTKEIVIYTLNSETLQKEAVTALVYVESELTPELIMEQVIDAMEDDYFYIQIDSITTEGKNIIVSFCADSTPVCNVGASVEGVILDAIGQSLLDNLPEYSGVIYRVEGGAYQSGHIEIGIDEVFISR
ncbi:MAG: hypothetical protein ACI4FZ_05690 [Lachnospiraceae bacterium]